MIGLQFVPPICSTIHAIYFKKIFNNPLDRKCVNQTVTLLITKNKILSCYLFTPQATALLKSTYLPFCLNKSGIDNDD